MDSELRSFATYHFTRSISMQRKYFSIATAIITLNKNHYLPTTNKDLSIFEIKVQFLSIFLILKQIWSLCFLKHIYF